MDELMSKIYFYTGCMYSGKSKALISLCEGYERDGQRFTVYKPVVDKRDGLYLKSRDKARQFKCLPINGNGELPFINPNNLSNIIVIDEVQFVEYNVLKWIIKVCQTYDIRLVLGGLSYDSNDKLFPTIRRLLKEYGEELKTTYLFANCDKCGFNGATVSHRVSGYTYLVDTEATYIPLCKGCYNEIGGH